MSWLTINTTKGRLKIKPRWQLRWAERTRHVRVVDLGLLLITWWSKEDLDRFR